AEDGIRDGHVTGVQTCALPIYRMVERLADDHRRAARLAGAVAERWPDVGCAPSRAPTNIVIFRHDRPALVLDHLRSEGVLAGTEIGRASCRERVCVWGRAGCRW